MSDSLAKIYKEIPSVDCIPGCTDCCGLIPMQREEAKHFGPFPLVDVGGGACMSTGLPCPNSKAGNCRIHENRPFVCRLFGAVTDRDTAGTSESKMVCPHGRKPRRPLKQREAAKLAQRYVRLSQS